MNLDSKVKMNLVKRAGQLKNILDKCVSVYKTVVAEQEVEAEEEPESEGEAECACLEVNGGTDMVWGVFKRAAGSRRTL